MEKNIMTTKDIKIAVIGIGYIGYPLIQLLSDHYNCIGLDIDKKRIECLNKRESDKNSNFHLTFDYKEIKDFNVYIVCVPTGVTVDKKPDLTPLTTVCESLGPVLNYGDLIIFESTVFPGATEEICVPLLEKSSGLRVNKDFSVGYSPERINVGDHQHSLENIPKVISATNEETMELLATIYSGIIDAPIIKATSIKVAEAAKMYENTQRDVLIALANEYSSFCKAEGINIEEVTECASSKWNFSRVNPGLVGGHCIGIDPYYLLERAQQHTLTLPLIKCARTINEEKVKDVFKKIIEIATEINAKTILLLGATYKANSNDCRNSKPLEIFYRLKEGYCVVDCFDPNVDKNRIKEELNLNVMTNWKELQTNYDLVVRLVNHLEFENLDFPKSKFLSLEELL